MFVCLDTETTGLNPLKDHLIEVAILHFDYEKIIGKWSTLIKPPEPIPEFTSRLTNITNEMVANAPKIEEIKEEILEKTGKDPVMGHFISFDINFLKEKGIDLKNEQLDTCRLSQTFMKNEDSYSLEVLTKKLDIKQDDAHRAMADCEANIELFWKLATHIKSLSTKEKLSIKRILQKSDWPWAKHILPLIEEAKKRETSLEKKEKTNKIIKERELIESEIKQPDIKDTETHADLSGLTKELNTPFLLEEASHTAKDIIDYAKNLEGNSLLVFPDLDFVPQYSRNESSEKTEAEKANGVTKTPDVTKKTEVTKTPEIIKAPENYIDEERFKEYLSKENLGEVETMLGIKVSLWLQNSKNKDRSEIKLIKDENREWNKICRKKPKQITKKISAIDQKHFLKEKSKKEPLLKMPENIIVAETENLIKEMEFSWKISLAEDQFESKKITIFFGLLGIFFEKYSEKETLFKTLPVESFHRTTPEWTKIMKAAEAINNKEKDPYLNYLKKIICSEKSVIWINLNREGDPVIHSFPSNPSELFRKRIWGSGEKLHLFCHHANLKDNFAFIKSELGLPEKMTCEESKDIIPMPVIETKSRISNPNNRENPAQVSKEISLQISGNEENCFLLVTSKKSAEQFFYSLKEITEKENMELFVQNMSGGLGKIYKMACENKRKNFFVGNENMLDFLLKKNVKISLLAIHRLPFSPPDNPIQKARAKRYMNTYKEFSLPQAALRFRSNVSNFLGNNWKNKRILILDPRVKENENLFL